MILNPRTILLLYSGAVTVAIVLVLILLALVLAEFKRTVKTTTRVIEEEIKPTLKNLSDSVGAMNRFSTTVMGRVENATKFLDTVIKANKQVALLRGRSQKYLRPGAVRLASLFFGLKKGVETILKKH